MRLFFIWLFLGVFIGPTSFEEEVSISDINDIALDYFKVNEMYQKIEFVKKKKSDLVIGVFLFDEYSSYVFGSYKGVVYVIDNYDNLGSKSVLGELGPSTRIYAFDLRGRIIWSLEQDLEMIEAGTFYNRKCTKVEWIEKMFDISFSQITTQGLTLGFLNKLSNEAKRYGFNYSNEIYSYFLKNDISTLIQALNQN